MTVEISYVEPSVESQFILSGGPYPCPCPVPSLLLLSPSSWPWLELRVLEVPDWCLASWSWFGYGHWSLVQLYSKFWLSILISKVQRTSMSFKSSFGALEDAGGSLLVFGILILIWIWSLVFATTMIQSFALYLDFEGAKNIMFFKSSFGVLEDAGGSWPGFGIFILIWIGTVVFDIAMI